MIQAIIVALVGIWLIWGTINVVWGLAQILWGAAYGIAAIALYTLACILEIAGKIARL